MLQKIANILWEDFPTENEVVVSKSREINLEKECPDPEDLTFSWASELTCDVERLLFERLRKID